jgi:hypothetical protein
MVRAATATEEKNGDRWVHLIELGFQRTGVFSGALLTVLKNPLCQVKTLSDGAFFAALPFVCSWPHRVISRQRSNRSLWGIATVFRGIATVAGGALETSKWSATTDDRMPRQIEFGHEHAGDESCLFGCLHPVIKIGFEFCRRLLFFTYFIFASEGNFANRLHGLDLINSMLGD